MKPRPGPKSSFRRRMEDQIKRDKVCFTVYVILRVVVIGCLVLSLLRGHYEHALLCGGTLLLLLAPAFVEKSFRVDLPTPLEVVVMCFIFAHAILGEIACFYVRVPGWDTMLHTLNGFLCAGIGLSLVDLLNCHRRFQFELSPLYMVIVAFCFSMTVGVLWEFFEFGSDMLLHTDMQKDTVIHSIHSVTLDPTASNTPVSLNGIGDVAVNGEPLGLDGYLDIGLIDTMKDLLVNFVGAVVFSVGGYFYLTFRGKKHRLIAGFVPVITDGSPEEPPTEQEDQSRDTGTEAHS